MNWGFNFAFMSTGARATIRDYSGGYSYDNKVVGLSFAFFEEIRFFFKEKLSLFLHADVGIMYSKVKLSEYFIVNSQIYTNESIKTMSFVLFDKPVVKAVYSILIN